jgi:hypothetical protein
MKDVLDMKMSIAMKNRFAALQDLCVYMVESGDEDDEGLDTFTLFPKL